MKRVFLLAILVISTIYGESFSTPTKESKIQKVTIADHSVHTIKKSEIKPCTKNTPLMIYAKSVENSPLNTESDPIVYVDKGYEKGFSLCRKKNGDVELELKTRILFPARIKESK